MVVGGRNIYWGWLAIFVLGLPSLSAAESPAKLAELPPAASRPVDFVRDIEPILAARCNHCHGADEQEGQLRLDARAIVMRGGQSGPLLEVGKSADSLLIHRVAGLGSEPRMPVDDEPLSAEESMKLIQVPPGFRLELFASEPDIVKPIALAWDERGRLWIAETVDYPNDIHPGTPGNDRIKILEDTDGDGRADKFTVFAENLNVPTGLVFANGGLIVSQMPDLLFFKDTNGDDKADVRQVLEDFNRRVVEARRQLLGGPPVVTRTRDVDAEIVRWQERRDAAQQGAASTAASVPERGRRRRLFRRR